MLDLRWEILSGYLPLFVAGLWMTLQLTLVSIAGGLLLGVAFGLVSSSVDAPPPKTRAGAWLWVVLAVLGGGDHAGR